MKILVVQLARLGDLYMTWPVLRAMQRTHPEAEIHLLARASFAPAVESFAANIRIHKMDMKKILAPLVSEKPDLDNSLSLIDEVLESLRAQKFGRVINLSFSPLSSFLVHALDVPNTVGYTRHSDGFLAIPDDPSSYFYAQVGPGSSNRIHLTELFSQIADVHLQAADWQQPELQKAKKQKIVFHLGASDARKSLSPSKWFQVIKYVASRWQGEIVLIGTKAEAATLPSTFASGLPENVKNLMGQTSLTQALEAVAEARVLVGGDSAPIHMAALTGTPVLNFSLPSVNLFETGPKTPGSRMVQIDDESQYGSDQLGRECLALAAQVPSELPSWLCTGYLEPYQGHNKIDCDVRWELLKAIYMGFEFPLVSLAEKDFYLGVQRMYESNQAIITQLESLHRQPNNKEAAYVLECLDQVLEKVSQLVPELGVLVRWLQTEKVRQGPASVEDLLAHSHVLHTKLDNILKLYILWREEGVRDANTNVG